MCFRVFKEPFCCGEETNDQETLRSLYRKGHIDSRAFLMQDFAIKEAERLSKISTKRPERQYEISRISYFDTSPLDKTPFKDISNSKQTDKFGQSSIYFLGKRQSFVKRDVQRVRRKNLFR